MKKWIIGLLAVLTMLSFVACGNYDKPDCCEETESKQEDCCESTASVPEYESDIPDCCGE